jgi:hypothetical protein
VKLLVTWRGVYHEAILTDNIVFVQSNPVWVVSGYYLKTAIETGELKIWQD